MFKTIPTLLFAIVLFVSCTQSAKPEQPLEVEVKVPVSEKSGTGLSGMFQVTDLSKWISIYNRDVNSSIQIGMLQNLDDPQLVYNLIWTENHEQGRELISSPQTATILQEGTASSEPQFELHDIINYNTGKITDTLRLAISLEVLNYSMWKSDFDGDQNAREQAGLTLVGMATNAENKNRISILFSCNDKQTAYDFLSSPNMKRLLTDSGVIGEPNMTWWRVINK